MPPAPPLNPKPTVVYGYRADKAASDYQANHGGMIVPPVRFQADERLR